MSEISRGIPMTYRSARSAVLERYEAARCPFAPTVCANCTEPIHLDGGTWVHDDDYAHCYGHDSPEVARPVLHGTEQ